MNLEGVFISVEGAGMEDVNGVYQRVDTFDDVGKYSMTVFRKGQNLEYFIYRCDDVDKKKRWNISNVHGGSYLYSAPQLETDPDYPPSTGWVSHSQIRKPVPDLHLMLSTVSIPESFAKTYRKMLFSEKFSDVKFVCGDEVIIHAHRIVLAESSSYFDAAFGGPWKENENGEWKTSHPSHTIKTVLRFLYTGKLDSKLVDEDPLAFISVASEYDLASLKFIAERRSIHLVNESNVKATLQSAYLYDSAILKNACVDFVKKNALTVLANSRISSLETEHPDLWQEFKKTIVS